MSAGNHSLTLKALLQNPELLQPINFFGDDSKGTQKDPLSPSTEFTGQSAFLGPNLWDKTLSYDVTGDFKDFKLEFMDLDEFFQENNIVDDILNAGAEKTPLLNGPPVSSLPPNIHVDCGFLQTAQLVSSSPSPAVEKPEFSSQISSLSSFTEQGSEDDGQSCNTCNKSWTNSPGVKISVEFELKEQDVAMASFPAQSSWDSCSASLKSPVVDFQVKLSDMNLVSMPGEDFDPRKRHFSEDELRPQPMMKKSKKICVPDDLKDGKYWQRRSKNNYAAKRSRDARRIKENQIAMRAAYLEKENSTLKAELKKALDEVDQLRQRLNNC